MMNILHNIILKQGRLTCVEYGVNDNKNAFQKNNAAIIARYLF